MLTLYLVCLMFGGTLLAISLFTGGDHDTDHGGLGHGDSDLHLGDTHIGGDVHGEIGHGGGDAHILDTGAADAETGIATPTDIHAGGHDIAHTGDVNTEVQGQNVGEAFKFISLRSLIFFTAFFGLTGSVLTWLTIGSALTFLSAIGMGSFASVLTHKLMNYFKRTESGESIDLKQLEGHSAQVVIPPTKSGKGKIMLEAHGQRHVLLALVDADSEKETFPPNAWVLILRVEGQLAYIIEADYIQ